MNAISIVPYSERWPALFEEERQRLLCLNGLYARVIEHVGSTAVPGLAAKPVIDLFIGVSPFLPLRHYQAVFSSGPYRYVPTDMEGRYLFARDTGGQWTHNLHLLPFDGQFFQRNELLLRDYLRQHPDESAAYAEVKRRCALEHGGSMEEYTRAKTGFIQRAVDCARAERGLPLLPVWPDAGRVPGKNKADIH